MKDKFEKAADSTDSALLSEPNVNENTNVQCMKTIIEQIYIRILRISQKMGLNESDRSLFNLLNAMEQEAEKFETYRRIRMDNDRISANRHANSELDSPKQIIRQKFNQKIGNSLVKIHVKLEETEERIRSLEKALKSFLDAAFNVLFGDMSETAFNPAGLSLTMILYYIIKSKKTKSDMIDSIMELESRNSILQKNVDYLQGIHGPLRTRFENLQVGLKEYASERQYLDKNIIDELYQLFKKTDAIEVRLLKTEQLTQAYRISNLNLTRKIAELEALLPKVGSNTKNCEATQDMAELARNTPARSPVIKIKLPLNNNIPNDINETNYFDSFKSLLLACISTTYPTKNFPERPLKKYVISFSGFSKNSPQYSIELKKVLSVYSRKLGARIHDGNFSNDITHLIVAPNSLTMKVFLASLESKWIITNYRWILDSVKANKFIQEDRYGEISQNNPFKGKKFYVSKEFEMECLSSKEDRYDYLQKLVVIHGKGSITRKESSLSSCDFIIRAENERTAHPKESLTWFDLMSMIRVPVAEKH